MGLGQSQRLDEAAKAIRGRADRAPPWAGTGRMVAMLHGELGTIIQWTVAPAAGTNQAVTDAKDWDL